MLWSSELADSLYRAYTNVLNTLKMREENFKRFNASVRSDLVKKWEEVDDTPRMNLVTKSVISVHKANFKICRYIVVCPINDFNFLSSPSNTEKGLPSTARSRT